MKPNTTYFDRSQFLFMCRFPFLVLDGVHNWANAATYCLCRPSLQLLAHRVRCYASVIALGLFPFLASGNDAAEIELV
jgi:hypothetical protein